MILGKNCGIILWHDNLCLKILIFAPVAQLDRASGYGPEGREFESSPARHLKGSHAVRHAALLSYRTTRRFEQDGFDICQNSDLPVDGPKVRVRVGRTVVRRANLLRRAT